MKVGVVIGHVWATKKEESLNGAKLMVVQEMLNNKKEQFVAVDTVGAGIGDKVIVTSGSSARMVEGKNCPIDAAIVGVIDALEIHEEEINGN